MRTAISIAAMALLAGCDEMPAGKHNKAAPAASAADAGFPEAGKYHVVHDTGEGSDSKREESDTSLDVSDRGKFVDKIAKDDGSNCRDKQVTIGGGSFSVHMVCDAPDGDIHNIALDRRGTYSPDSIDMTTDTQFWGTLIRETSSYRLKDN